MWEKTQTGITYRVTGRLIKRYTKKLQQREGRFCLQKYKEVGLFLLLSISALSLHSIFSISIRVSLSRFSELRSRKGVVDRSNFQSVHLFICVSDRIQPDHGKLTGKQTESGRSIAVLTGISAATSEFATANAHLRFGLSGWLFWESSLSANRD